MARWHSCNVLQVGPDRREVWNFDGRKDGFVFNQEQSLPNSQPLPARVVGKTWQTLFRKRLNIAWLPPEQVFLRVAHLPASNFDETLAMVELQLEKLSPLPVTHIVWNLHVMPQTTDGLQTVIVIIVARNLVEDFLGKLEGQGFLADRLEVSMVDLLQSLPVSGDGAWVYPQAVGDQQAALVAWWYGGTLRHLGLISLPPGQDRASAIREQFAQMVWAGELEGWLTSAPTLHLVAEPATASEWESALREGIGEPVRVLFPLPPAELAAATAKRVANAPARANLLPPEFSILYQQQFVDRLWMRALAAVVGLYLIGLLIYFAAVQGLTWRTEAVERKVAVQSLSYTNALQLKARYQVLKDRQDLKFAALDCWRAVAELLPTSTTLQGLDFGDGHKLTLTGTTPLDQASSILDFYEALRKQKSGDQLLFSRLEPLSSHTADRSVQWNFSCELNRTETR